MNHDNGGNPSSGPGLPRVIRQLSPAPSPEATSTDQHSASLPCDDSTKEFTIEELEDNDPLLATTEVRLPDEYEEPPSPQSQDSGGAREFPIAPWRPTTLEDQMLDLSFYPSLPNPLDESEKPVVGTFNRKRAFSETFTEIDNSNDVHMRNTDIPGPASTPSKRVRSSYGQPSHG